MPTNIINTHTARQNNAPKEKLKTAQSIKKGMTTNSAQSTSKKAMITSNAQNTQKAPSIQKTIATKLKVNRYRPKPIHKTALIICSLMYLNSCSLNKHASQTQFNSLITADGLKLFEMRFPGPKPSAISIKKAQASSGWSDKKVFYYLKDTLEQNKYCRQGYIILGRYAGETTHKIRGECKEPATPSDQKQYPNTITRW